MSNNNAVKRLKKELQTLKYEIDCVYRSLGNSVVQNDDVIFEKLEMLNIKECELEQRLKRLCARRP